MAGRMNQRPTLGLLEESKDKYGGQGICSILIEFAATKLPNVVDSPEKYGAGLPWEIWEGTTKVWEAARFEYLRPGKDGAASGSARVPVGDLLQAVLDTHPTWTVGELLEATRDDTEEEALKADKAETAAAEAREKMARDAAIARARKVEAEDAEAAVDRAEDAKKAEAIEAAMAAREEAAKAAKDEVTAREKAAKAAKDAAEARGNATNNPTDIYKNFFIMVNLGGERGQAEWTPFEIDMCVHGC